MVELLAALALATQSAEGRNSPEFQRLLRNAMQFAKMEQDKRIPRLRDVITLERALSRTRCVGSVDNWNRKYAFALRDEPVSLNTSTIHFALMKPHNHVGLGRSRVPPRQLFSVDDGFFDAANGTYSIRTHKVTFDYCGPNHPGQPTKPGS